MGIELYSVAGPSSTSDRALIDSTLASSNSYQRYALTLNKNLTASDLQALAQDQDEMIRARIATRKDIPSDLLETLTKDSSDRVRLEAITNTNWDFNNFKEVIMNQNFSLQALGALRGNSYSAADLEVFKHLWEIKARLRDGLIWSLCCAISDHTVDSKIFPYLDSEILTQSKTIRERYASFPEISNPAVLDKMKTDPSRSVISLIASNPKAWASTHEFIFLNHKSASTRKDIARVTKDNDLLNLIYRSTKGKRTLDVVKNNPHFVLYV